MNEGDRTRLTRNLVAATDDALVALANRGIVRRAAKDLEKQTLSIDETDDAVLVKGDGWVVTMPPDGPSAATDDTPASGVTRQIVAATMYLRDHWCDAQPESDGSVEETSPQENVAAEEVVAAQQRLIDAQSKDLFKWAGKTPLLEAAAALGTAGEASITLSPQLTVRFEAADVSVVLMTDQPAKTLRKLLDQFKSTAPPKDQPRWILMAVLALKRAAGQDVSVKDDGGAELTAAIRDDRLRVGRRTTRLLTSIAAAGTAHPSTRLIDRIRTTAVAAEAAKFPRLARLLYSIADDAQLQIDRDAAADSERMTGRMAVAFALADAGSQETNSERGDLFGRARSQYLPAGELDLAGLGAYGWRTASGFEGLTALFWDQNGQRFLTASATRGEGQDRTFSIRYAMECGLGWSGGDNVDRMCRKRLKLTDAKTNPEGRLSLAESVRATPNEPTDPTSLEFGDRLIDRWEALVDIAHRAQPFGLRLPDPRDSLVIIRPSTWGDRWFDELDQAFVWQVLDADDKPLQLRVPWSEVDEEAVVFLESLKPDRDRLVSVLGRLEVRGGGLSVYPLTVFSEGTKRGDKVLCPQFDLDRIQSRNARLLGRLRKKFGREKKVQTRIGEEGDDEGVTSGVEELAAVPPLVRTLVLEVSRVLSVCVQSGMRFPTDDVTRTVAYAKEQFAALGVEPMSDALESLLKDDAIDSASLLKALYRTHLFRQSVALSRLG